jgi:hypothetical protein
MQVDSAASNGEKSWVSAGQLCGVMQMNDAFFWAARIDNCLAKIDPCTKVNDNTKLVLIDVVHIYIHADGITCDLEGHSLMTLVPTLMRVQELYMPSSSHRTGKLFLLVIIYTLFLTMGFPSSLDVLPSPLALLPPAFNSCFANLFRYL